MRLFGGGRGDTFDHLLNQQPALLHVVDASTAILFWPIFPSVPKQVNPLGTTHIFLRTEYFDLAWEKNVSNQRVKKQKKIQKENN